MEGFEHEWDQKSLEWDLKPGDLVIDVGGYKGRWSGAIADKFKGIDLQVFEPQSWAARLCDERLGGRGRVFVMALGVKQDLVKMGGFGTDGASLFKTAEWFSKNPWAHADEVGDVVVVDADEFLKWSVKDRPIRLMMMNIEGGEYELLPYLIKTGWMDRIEALMVQFHVDYVGAAVHQELVAQLDQLFEREFDYGTVLTAWRKNLGAKQPPQSDRSSADDRAPLERPSVVERDPVQPLRRPSARRGVQK